MDAILQLVGSGLSLAGIIWIMVIAIQDGEVIWGIASFFCCIAAAIYSIQNWDRCQVPFLITVVGICLSAAGRVMAPGV